MRSLFGLLILIGLARPSLQAQPGICSATVTTPANRTVCVGTLTTPVAFSGAANTYTWTNSNPAIGLPASGTGTISSFVPVNTTGSPLTATITVTPQRQTFAYISNYSGSGNLNILNTTTQQIVSSIYVGSGATGVAVSPDGSRVYVADVGSHSVTVIDASTQQILATISLEGKRFPYGICVSPDGSRVYTGNLTGTTSVINTITNQLVTTISVGSSAFGVAISPDGQYVYTTVDSENKISVINTANNQVETTIGVGGAPLGIAISADGSRIYTANLGSNTVSVVNTSTNQVISTVSVGDGPIAVTVNPAGNRLYAVNAYGDNVSVINLETNSVVATVGVGDFPYGANVSPDGNRVYVANSSSRSVSVINTSSNQVETTVSVEGAALGIGSFVGPASCVGAAKTFTITVDPQPQASLSASGVISCTTPSVTLTAGGGTTYSFSGPGIVNQDASAGTALVNVPGDYWVRVTTASGCVSSATLTVGKDTQVPTLSLNPTSGTLTCSTPEITLTARSSTPDLLWNTGLTTSSITVRTAGTYSVTATAGNGCQATVSVEVSEDQKAPPVTLANNGPLSAGQSVVTLTATQLAGASYAFSSGTTPGSTMNTAIVSTPGTYSVTVTAPNGCTASAQTTVEVNAGMVSSLELINAANDQLIKTLSEGEVINLTALPTTKLTIRALTEPATVGSVVFTLAGTVSHQQTETGAPYALFGDERGNYDPWTLPLGSYILTATPYLGAGGTGPAGTPLTIHFSIVNQAVNQPPLARAGADQALTLPTSQVSLNGSTSSDPEGGALTYQWS